MGIIATLESAEDTGEDLITSSTAESDASVASATTDIVEATSDIKGDVSEIDAATSDAGELEALGDVVEESIESGKGLSDDGAQAVIVAVESALLRLGMTHAEIARKVPSFESFGNSQTRLSSSKAAFETIMETLSRVWQHIKDFAKKVVERIISFFSQLFNSVAGLKKSVEMLKKRLESLPADATAKETEITGSFAKLIEVNGVANFKSVNDLFTNAEKLVGFMNEASKHRYAILTSFTSTLGSNKVDEAALKTKLADNNNFFDTALKTIPSSTGTRTNWEDVSSYGPFAGGVILTTGFKSADDKADGALSITFEKVKEPKAEKAAVLNKNEIKQVIGDIEAGIVKFETFKKTIPEEKKISDQISKICDKVISQYGKNTDSGKKDEAQTAALKSLRVSVSAMINGGNVLLTNGPSTIYRTLAVGYEYASKSLNEYKAPKKD